MPLILSLVLSVTFASALAAQDALTGFTPSGAARERTLERTLQTSPDTGSARRDARTLSARAHVAGSPAQTETADYVLREMARAGLDTSRIRYQVYLPYPESTIVERVTPSRIRFRLEEPPIAGDSSTTLPPWPAMNAYSGAGEVTAPIVYVNYGLADDYAALDSLGVTIRGRIAVARYGRSYRGIKAREAEARGAAALLLYSDPEDDGYVQGDVYPDGPMRPPDAVQRGSINNGRGDPSTPGRPSLPGAKRLPLDSMLVVRIPVVPLGYRNAALLLKELGGRSVPQDWQGGLPFRYHVGGEGVIARVGVWPEQGERAYKTIVNTIATLRGSDWPDELVLTGAHRDSWGPGAVDDVSGVVSLLGAARAWGERVRKGMRPRRTLVFATWDAEEWGVVGSIEYVEQFAAMLQRDAVAYVNQDVAASGRAFGAAATASLHDLIRDAARAVAQPGDSVSIYRAWRRAGGDSTEPKVGDLGGGSDFAGFYNHLGLPSLDFGFAGPYGVYHSAYDTYTYVERFADPGFLSHTAAARLAAVILARLANAHIIPLDYATFARYLAPVIAQSARSAAARGWKLDYPALENARNELQAAGGAFNMARDSALRGKVSRDRLAEVNRLLRGVEREMTRSQGLVGRTWMRNLIFAADRDNGYATIALPGVAEAIRDKDEARTRREVNDLAARFTAAARRVDAARRALESR